jgi:hypothetical protein
VSSRQAPTAPDDLWNEEGDRVWIRHDLCESAGKARYKAFTGEGLPTGFREMDADLIELRVRVVWAREQPLGAYDEWPWKLCGRDDPGAVKFWEVS